MPEPLTIAEQRSRASRSLRASAAAQSGDFVIDPDTGDRIPTVAGEERCDPAWEQANADARRTAWEEERQTLTASLRKARQAQPLTERLSTALARMQRLSNLKARPISSTGKGSGEHPGGGRPPGDDDPVLEAALRRVRIAIEDLEHRLDEESGMAPATNLALQPSVVKDRELLSRHAGVPATRVALEFPQLGSKTAIYRKRRDAGFSSLGLLPNGAIPSEADVRDAVRRLHDPKRYLDIAV